MLETSEKEIDGTQYQYQPLMLKPARALFDKILKHCGPAVAAGLKAFDKVEGYDLDSNQAELISAAFPSIGSVIETLTKDWSSDFHTELANKILGQMKYMAENGFIPLSADAREVLLGDRLLLEFKLILFGLEAQYKDFFVLLRGMTMKTFAVKAMTTATSRLNSQKISTGQSTE